jgi:beta-glucosidase
MKKIRPLAALALITTVMFAAGCGLTDKSGKSSSAHAVEQISGSAGAELKDIKLYGHHPLSPWHIFIENYEQQQMLSGASASLPKGDVSVKITNKDSQENALAFNSRMVNLWI